MNKNAVMILLAITAAAATSTAIVSYVRERGAKPVAEQRQMNGFVRAAYAKDGAFFLDIDEMRFLSGKEAAEAGAEDTGCPVERIEECVPSMNNDFYIRNLDAATTTYELPAGAHVSLMLSPGSPVLSSSTASEFVSLFKNKDMYLDTFPFNFVVRGNVISSAEEQYVP